MALFIEIRVFRYDENEHGVYAPSAGEEIARQIVPFANLSNATSVYDDLEKTLDRARERGVDLASERIKPGPKGPRALSAAANTAVGENADLAAHPPALTREARVDDAMRVVSARADTAPRSSDDLELLAGD